jgi:hypothetical protein
MTEHMRANRWVVLLSAAALAALVGVLAYNAGFSHGIVQSGQAASDPRGFPPYAYGWYRPWGFGFLFPFLFFGFWFFVLRVLVWGGPWRRYRYYARHHDGPPMFDDWHRRAHERMTADQSGTRTDENRPRG